MNHLIIADIPIRQDEQGRFSFNDLHKSAVAAGHDYKRCQIEHFTRNDTTQELINELRKNGELKIDPYISTAGRYGGTWGCKELVYAYAMWISPSFNLKVIRAYDAMQHGNASVDPMKILNDPAAMRGLLLGYTEKVIVLEEKVGELTPKAEAFDRLSTAEGAMNLTNSAKHLQIRPQEFIQFLSAQRYIYKCAGSKSWVAYQNKIQQGLFVHKQANILRADGTEKVCEQVLVTPKGLSVFALKLSMH